MTVTVRGEDAFSPGFCFGVEVVGWNANERRKSRTSPNATPETTELQSNVTEGMREPKKTGREQFQSVHSNVDRENLSREQTLVILFQA